jgi:5-methylcytosine-specific restriction protein B
VAEHIPLSVDAQQVLAEERCVLINGVPAAGKTRLMQEIREAWRPPLPEGRLPTFDPSSEVALPSSSTAPPTTLPSGGRSDRRVWQTAMAPSSRYRQFWRDVEPQFGGTGFQVSRGVLFDANEHALSANGCSLVIIDELNRGPTVEVFGPSIVAIEGDKRLDPNGRLTPRTSAFQLAGDDGAMIDYALSSHLYLLAAMNRADVSAEALDQAFLRRWGDFELRPREEVLTEFFELNDLGGELPETPTAVEPILGAAVRAWRAVNRKLLIGASEDAQIGHGVLIRPDRAVPQDVPDALDYVGRGWELIERHVRETFYGNDEAIADALLMTERSGHPYTLTSQTFAGAEVFRVERPAKVDIYRLLRLIAGS